MTDLLIQREDGQIGSGALFIVCVAGEIGLAPRRFTRNPDSEPLAPGEVIVKAVVTRATAYR